MGDPGEGESANPLDPLDLILPVLWLGRGKAVGKRRELGCCLEVREGAEKEREKEARTGNFIAFGHQKRCMQMKCK